jgi:hypothetical protein
LKELTDSYSGGFLIFALTGFACAGLLLYVGRSWEGAFLGQGGLAATAGLPAARPAAASEPVAEGSVS